MVEVGKLETLPQPAIKSASELRMLHGCLAAEEAAHVNRVHDNARTCVPLTAGQHRWFVYGIGNLAENRKRLCEGTDPVFLMQQSQGRAGDTDG